MNELAEVMAFDSRIDAEMARELLLEQGIESIIRAADCGGMLMGVSLVRKGGIKLMVADNELEKARGVLSVLETEIE